MNQVLALHAVQATESLRGDDPNDPVVITELHLIWWWESLFQDLLEFPSYCHWKTPFSMNRWAALRRSCAFALSKSPLARWYNFSFLRCAWSRASEAKR